MQFKLGELFSGPGGLALGAKLASINIDGYAITHGWANDIDRDSCDTYRLNICPENPESVIQGAVQDLDVTKLPKINAFAYGFPCNDFSVVGDRKGFNGTYGPLYSYGLKVLDYHEPLFFFAENVGGMHNIHEGSAFKKILSDLSNAGKGYVLTPHLYEFEKYGVPQMRHRIVVVGIRKDLGLEFKVPKPTHPDPETWNSAGQAISNPPIPANAANQESTKQSKLVEERLRHIPPGENAWYKGLPEHLRLNVKGAKLSMIYKRLHPDKPSYTVTGSGGGGTHVYHWDEPRALTNRERARLQTFPDDYVFCGSKESVRKQIGMAVPPQGAKVIFEAILKTFAKIRYVSTSSRWEMNDLAVQEEMVFDQD